LSCDYSKIRKSFKLVKKNSHIYSQKIILADVDAVKDGTTRKILDFKGATAGSQYLPASLASDSERLYFIRWHSEADIWTAQLEYR
jgi:hypothetical protein